MIPTLLWIFDGKTGVLRWHQRLHSGSLHIGYFQNYFPGSCVCRARRAPGLAPASAISLAWLASQGTAEPFRARSSSILRLSSSAHMEWRVRLQRRLRHGWQWWVILEHYEQDRRMQLCCAEGARRQGWERRRMRRWSTQQVAHPGSEEDKSRCDNDAIETFLKNAMSPCIN